MSKHILKIWSYISSYNLLDPLDQQWFSKTVKMQAFQIEQQESPMLALGVGATAHFLQHFMLYGFGQWGNNI
jgi:hypothetical protein